ALRRDARSASLGRVPDRAERAAAVQALGGARLVDVADQAAVDAIADELLQPRREALHQVRIEPELLVLLLADEADAIVHGDACAPPIGAVGSAAVPERPVPDQHAALRHIGGD